MKLRTVLGAAGLVALVVTALLLHRAVSPSDDSSESGGAACARDPLADLLSWARTSGVSTILAHGALTGRTATDGRIYHEMALRSVRTLSGPAVGTDGAGWVSSGRGPGGPLLGADAGALWGTDGGLFASSSPPHWTTARSARNCG